MAVTIVASELRDELGLVDDTAGNAKAAKLLAIATQLSNLEGAVDAPDEVSNEAVTLVAGHLEDRIPGRLQSLDVGPVKLQLRAVGSAVRLSGARTLLSPWHARDLAVEPED